MYDREFYQAQVCRAVEAYQTFGPHRSRRIQPVASVRSVEPVIRFCAVISRHDDLRQRAIEQLAGVWGPVVTQSPDLDFQAGGFYAPTMGQNLKKTLVALEGFVDPAGLADWKLQTNKWEADIPTEFSHPEPRPLNLDPGYMSQAKLVLATTKDRDHRIYLRDGMFAEVTLTYVGKTWQHHRWSYPSYRSEAVAAFANECRTRLRKHLRETKTFRVG